LFNFGIKDVFNEQDIIQRFITDSSKGHGKIDASGGRGYGGGAGGRIALHVRSSLYRGALIAVGGAGSQDHGGTGTVYIEDERSIEVAGNVTKYHYTTLILNNLVRRFFP